MYRIKFFTLLVSVIVTGNLYAQSTGNKEKATYKEYESLNTRINEAKATYETSRKNKDLDVYYSPDSLFKYDKLLRKKAAVMRSDAEAVETLNRNYAMMTEVFKNMKDKSAPVLKTIDSLMQDNDRIVEMGISGWNESMNAAFDFENVVMQFTDSNNAPITNLRCYFVSRYKCREILCADCARDSVPQCTAQFLEKLKENIFFDAVNPQPIKLMPGGYIMFVLNDRGEVVKHDFRDFTPTNTAETVTVKMKL